MFLFSVNTDPRVKIKHRIIVLQIVVVSIVLMMAGVAFLSHRYSDYYLRRVEWTNYQLDAITSVSLHANDYLKQIVELLLIGDDERSDYKRSAQDLSAELESARKLTLNEHAFLLRMGEPSNVKDELQRLDRMAELSDEMAGAVEEMLRLRKAERQEDAVQLFRQKIEQRLGAEFDSLLRAAVLSEQQKVARAEHRADDAWARIIWVTLAAAFLALAVCLITAQRLASSLLRPIRHLIAGTKAVGRGDLSGHIAYQGNDELGLLAQGFNRMGAQLKEQRTLVENAQTNLENQVTDRTRQLAQANSRLSELDRQRVQFLADVSHELRTPLTALRGEAEITLRRPPANVEAYQDVLARIVDLTGDMKRLVDDLLFLARTEAETLRFEPEPVHLQPLLEKLAHEGNILGRDKQIRVDIRAESTPAWIMADPHRLRQALMIVIDNAIKYSPQDRSVTLTMDTGGSRTRILVHDQGHGIRIEDLPHVFDRFYRGTRNADDGLGLGLPIAHRLIEKQDGLIDITSEPGDYTEVRVEFAALHDAD